jgi:hypothetical protein
VNFTPLEQAILEWIGESVDDPVLKRQLAVAMPVERTFTGVGSFTTLCVPEDSPRRTGTSCPHGPLIRIRYDTCAR